MAQPPGAQINRQDIIAQQAQQIQEKDQIIANLTNQIAQESKLKVLATFVAALVIIVAAYGASTFQSNATIWDPQSILPSFQKASEEGCKSVLRENTIQLLMAEKAQQAQVIKNLTSQIATLVAASATPKKIRHSIDPNTPLPGTKLLDPYTAVKTAGESMITLRSKLPLTPINHRWAVRIHEVGSYINIMLGLLPKLSAEMTATMGQKHIDQLGGWNVYQIEDRSAARGEWESKPEKLLPFAQGDLVFFDFDFGNRWLTISCGVNQVKGRIPDIGGGELYPAFTIHKAGTRVSFEKYPE